eukprot:33381_1
MRHVFLWHVLSIYTVHCITRSAYLTPNAPSNNGAFISVLKDVTTTNKWQIHVSDLIGFHLQLTLDQTYAFHNTENSSLTINIGSNTAPSDLDLEFIVSFSQSQDKYVTYVINLDTASDYPTNHSVYPNCQESSPYTVLANGNIEELCNQDNTNEREHKVTNEGQKVGFVSRYVVQFPMSFTLTNYPGSHTLITYDDEGLVTQASCGFVGFDTGVPLMIFFAGEDVAEVLNISFVEIIYSDSLNPVSEITTSTDTIASTMNNSVSSGSDDDDNNDDSIAISVAIFGTCLLMCVTVVIWKRTRLVVAKKAAAHDKNEEPDPQIQVIERASGNNAVIERSRSDVSNVNDVIEKRDDEQQTKGTIETTEGLHKKLSPNDILNRKIVKQWLENTVELSQYVDAFISNGYESMQIIVEIQDISELAEIGIVSKQHQTKIKEEIMKLHQDNEIESMEGHGGHGNDEMITVEGDIHQ